MNKPFAVVAMLCLMRERDARARGDHGAAVAYANAYDWLCYAVDDRDDCLSQFDGYDEANAFLNAHADADLWMMEDLFKN